VGKTSLLNSYVDQKFVNSYKATVGADFMEKEVIVDGKVINLEVLILQPRSGTLQDRKNLGAWEAHSTEAQIVVYSFMTSQIER
jgi:GTPase SAR1 family protein